MAVVDNVKEFLQKQGYPLEYATARTLKRLGYETQQGLTFRDEDAVPPKTREMDVVATVSGTAPIDVGLVIECKAAPQPWLVLTRTTEDEAPVAPHMLTCQDNGRVQPTHLQFRGWVLPPRHGFSVVTAGGELKHGQTDPVYAALTGVTKGAASQVNVSVYEFLRVFVPVLVTSGSLLRLGYDDDGTEILDEVLWQRVIWNGSPGTPGPKLVDVVTAGHLEAYGRMMLQALAGLAANLARDQPPHRFGSF